MKKKVFYFLVALFMSRTLPVFAQTSASGVSTFTETKERFLRALRDKSIDPAIANPLARDFESAVNDIYASIISNTALTEIEREKGIRSLVYFMKELNRYIIQQKRDLYDIPGALQAYKRVLTAIINHKPLAPILEPLSPRHSQLMAASFSQYKEYTMLDDIAVYKRVASSPEFILHFVEHKPGFRFADSLLLDAAAHDPMKVIYHLNYGKPGTKNSLQNSRNAYLNQITALSNDKNASELMPFVVQLAEGKMTREEILTKRAEVLAYFQLLVNTVQESLNSGDAGAKFFKPLRDGLKQKSLSFYVNEINALHSASDAVRFASVKNLRPQDIYYIITSCGEELYTSSYLGLYKRLMEQFKNQSADSLFGIVQFDNFRVFMRLAANYNVLSDFLHRMPGEKMKDLLSRFMTGIGADADTGLEKAMDIADFFAAAVPDAEISELIRTGLQTNLDRSRTSHQYLGVRLYSILSQVFELVIQGDGQHKIWTILGNYEVLKRDALQNKKDEIIQLVLFYGDEDGVASFNNFLKLYSDNGKWEISRNENWVSIRSISDKPLIIFANKPLDSKDELDLKAQDSLLAFLSEQSCEPAILIHRGHSYHLDKTMKRLTPSVKLAILGSCGSYNKAISMASINPEVQVIGSKKMGSKSINDPIIEVINETLISNNDLSWPEVWKKLETRFYKDEFALSLFNEYFPPDKNLSLFVLKLFNY